MARWAEYWGERGGRKWELAVESGRTGVLWNHLDNYITHGNLTYLHSVNTPHLRCYTREEAHSFMERTLLQQGASSMVEQSYSSVV